MNYRTVSSKAIIEKVFRSLGNLVSQDSDRLLGNGIEWIGEGLQLIGILPAMDKISEVFIVEQSRVPLPCNLYLIESVSYKDEWLPYSGRKFNYDLHCTNCINEYDAAKNLDFSYTVNPNYLMTNLPDGEEICISYVGFKIDEEGFPEVPDNQQTKEALFWFILRSMMLGGFEHPNKQITFQTCDELWKRYAAQADVTLNMLDSGRMETFRRMWVRMIPDQNRYKNFFANDTVEEQLRQRNKIWRY
jgi:hypothetical protein